MSGRMVMKAQEPPPLPERHDWVAVAKRLRKNPGVWHLVVEGCKASTINAVRQGSIAALRDPGFEVRQDNTQLATESEPKKADLYLRFVEGGES